MRNRRGWRDLHRAARVLGLATVLSATLGGAVAASAQGTEGSCANEAIRKEQGSSYLPDCRAYELVSPPGATALQNSLFEEERTRAAAAGGALSWFSFYPPPSAQSGGMFFLSRRSASGWSTESLILPLSTESSGFECKPSVYMGPQLQHEVLQDGFETLAASGSATVACGRNEPPLIGAQQAATMRAAGLQVEPEGSQNLYLHAPGSALYQPLNLTPNAVVPADAWLQDVSDDFTHVAFDENAKLTEDAPEGEAAYEWVNGTVYLISVLPSGTPAPGTMVDRAKVPNEANEALPHFVRGLGAVRHALSGDGRRAFFESHGDLYVRLNPEAADEVTGVHSGAECAAKACTLQLDASVAGGAGGGGRFLVATEDGATVFFMDSAEAKLTSDTQEGSGENLYSYQVETGELTDLTPQAHVELHGMLGFGERAGGYHLYFDAEGVLTGANAEGRAPLVERPNLYVLASGHGISFIGTLQPEAFREGLGVESWQRGEEESDAASPNGDYFVFGSLSPLTEYDNVDPSTGERDRELFLYDASAESVACVSCQATGAPPVGPVHMQTLQQSGGQLTPLYLRRSVLNDGTVFFTTPQPLVQADINDRPDVYEYTGGNVHLLSGGVEAYGAYFVEASAYNPATGREGEEVFFISAQRLLGAPPGGPVIYDAHRDGGFPEPSKSPECAGEECRSTVPTAPAFAAPASVAFVGLGNLKPSAGKQRKRTNAPKKGGAKGSKGKAKRRHRLHRALKVCKHRFRHNRHRRRACKRRARRRYGAKAKGAARDRVKRRHGRAAKVAHHDRRARHAGERHRRHRGGAR